MGPAKHVLDHGRLRPHARVLGDRVASSTASDPGVQAITPLTYMLRVTSSADAEDGHRLDAAATLDLDLVVDAGAEERAPQG